MKKAQEEKKQTIMKIREIISKLERLYGKNPIEFILNSIKDHEENNIPLPQRIYKLRYAKDKQLKSNEIGYPLIELYITNNAGIPYSEKEKYCIEIPFYNITDLIQIIFDWKIEKIYIPKKKTLK